MTFLEYTCFALLGEPHRSLDHGEHYWDCPWCGSPKFHTRPHKAKFKDKVSCWKCQKYGDTMDLLACLFPDETRAEHAHRWKMLREEWEAMPADQQAKPSGHIVNSPGLRGQGGAPRKLSGSDDPAVIATAFADLTVEQMLSLACAFNTAARHGVDLHTLAAKCAETVADVLARHSQRLWGLKMDWMHLQECRDPDCDAAICRQMSGKPPLSQEDIRELQERCREMQYKWGEAAERIPRAWRPREYKRFAERYRNEREHANTNGQA